MATSKNGVAVAKKYKTYSRRYGVAATLEQKMKMATNALKDVRNGLQVEGITFGLKEVEDAIQATWEAERRIASRATSVALGLTEKQAQERFEAFQRGYAQGMRGSELSQFIETAIVVAA